MSQTLTGTRTALMTMYRKEYIAGFERGTSSLRATVTTEFMTQGNAVVFLVADTGSATATTRGSDGLIPARVNNNNQVTLTLSEFNDLPRMNDFDIFSSQGPQKDIMFQGAQIVIGRTIDNNILTALDTGTLGLSASASTDALGMFQAASTVLKVNNAEATRPGDISAVVSPAFYQRLLKTKEFSNVQYVEEKRLINGHLTPVMFTRFQGVNIIEHTGISGVGTASEKCFMYHRNAIGHALNRTDGSPTMGYNEEQNYSWVRDTIYHASSKLQNSGIIEMLHDGSEFTTTTV